MLCLGMCRENVFLEEKELVLKLGKNKVIGVEGGVGRVVGEEVFILLWLCFVYFILDYDKYIRFLWKEREIIFIRGLLYF